jgi:REP element-mobilizing transposase RayT
MFTICGDHRRPVLANAAIVARLVEQLALAAEKHGCTIPIYTFVPDHAHCVVLGMRDDSDCYATMVSFRHEVGMRVREVSFQKDFYDRVIRWFEGWETEVRYIARNPVRKGLADDPLKWPFTGSIGHDLRDILGL